MKISIVMPGSIIGNCLLLAMFVHSNFFSLPLLFALTPVMLGLNAFVCRYVMDEDAPVGSTISRGRGAAQRNLVRGSVNDDG